MLDLAQVVDRMAEFAVGRFVGLAGIETPKERCVVSPALEGGRLGVWRVQALRVMGKMRRRMGVNWSGGDWT